jgi:hypothetical protein
MRIKKTFVHILAVLIFLSLFGCSIASLTSFIAPVSPISSPFSSAVGTPTHTPGIPAPALGKGTIAGVVYFNNKPYAERDIYLAKVGNWIASDGKPAGQFAELDVNTDPRGYTDAGGRFLIENVEPGQYVLAVRLPSLQENLLADAETNTNFFVELKSNQVTTLGTIRIVNPGEVE